MERKNRGTIYLSAQLSQTYYIHKTFVQLEYCLVDLVFNFNGIHQTHEDTSMKKIIVNTFPDYFEKSSKVSYLMYFGKNNSSLENHLFFLVMQFDKNNR